MVNSRRLLASERKAFYQTYFETLCVPSGLTSQGLAKKTFYAMPQYRDVYFNGTARRKGAGWWREWPEAWEQIDSE